MRGFWTLPSFSVFSRTVLLWIALAGVMALAGSQARVGARAQAGLSVSLTAEAGFDGFCKADQWLPVRVMLENRGPDLEGRLLARLSGFNGGRSSWGQDVSLPQGARKGFLLPVFFESGSSSLQITLLVGEQEAARANLTPRCLSPDETLFGVLSDTPSTFDPLAELNPPAGRLSIAHLLLEDLPDSTPALRALDLLVFSNVDISALSDSQRAALANWVAEGGRLLVTGGLGWRTASGLEGLLPVRISSTRNLPGLDSLPPFVDLAETMDGETPVAVAEPLSGSVILAEQDKLPLVVRRQYGAGTVVWLAFDPALEPFANWGSRLAFYQKLLGTLRSHPTWSEGFVNGYSAHSALTTLPELTSPGAGIVLGFLLLYVIVAGPVNWVVLRLLKRRELAWVTVPLLAVLFSGLALVAGGQTLGSRPVVNAVALLQARPDAPLARVDGLSGVYSPQRATYALQVAPGWLAHSLPNVGSALADSSERLYLQRIDGALSVPNLRVDVAGMEGFALQGEIPAPELETNLILRLDEEFAALEGRLSNESDWLLEDAVLILPGEVQQLGELQPGAARDLQTLLKLEARAAPAAGSLTAYPGPAPFPQGGRAYTNLITDILGTPDTSRDSTIYRRSMLLYATSLDGSLSSGSGFYLAGWSTRSPLPVELVGESPLQSSLTLLVFELRPEISTSNAWVQLPPGLFEWSALENPSGGVASPYDAYLTGSMALRFTPSLPVTFQQVDSLTLHLDSYGATGPAYLEGWLWNFASGEWEALPDLNWGDLDLPDPARFVGPGAEIRLRLQSPDLGSASIEAADFTLGLRR